MSCNAKNIVLVCEDTAHKTFVGRCIKEFYGETIRRRMVPVVASEQFVGGNRTDAIELLKTKEFPSWLRRNAGHKVLLVAVLDADTDDTEKLLDCLPAPGRYANLYVILLPKRNIQTWVELARGAASVTSEYPDETTDFKRTATRRDSDAGDAAVQLMRYYRNPPSHLAENPVWRSFVAQMNALQRAVGVLKD